MNTSTAKQLLKKAIALGDSELIELANQALGIGLTESNLVMCQKCNYEFEPKGKKSCPKCRGRKFSKVIQSLEEYEEEEVRGNKKSGKKRASVVNIDLEYSQKIMEGLHKEDTDKFDKKVKFNISDRRDKIPDKKVTCQRCNQQYIVPGSTLVGNIKGDGGGSINKHYICGRCAGKS